MQKVLRDYTSQDFLLFYLFNFIVFLGSLHVKILVTVVEPLVNFRFETGKIVDVAYPHPDQLLALYEPEEVLAFLKFLHDGG